MPIECQIEELRPKAEFTAKLAELLAGYSYTLPFADNEATEIKNLTITNISVASSEILPDGLFVAVGGLHTHGAKYLNHALEKGAVAVLTDEAGVEIIRHQGTKIPVICTDLPPRAVVGVLASRLYQDPSSKIPVIAVTGTNGKTTTSFMVRTALGGPEKVSLTGTVETRIAQRFTRNKCTTLEASVIQRLLATAVAENCDYAVVETSSHALIQGRVKGVKAKLAIFTNLSEEHLDFHKDMTGYLEAKALLFTPEYADYGVICVDTEAGQKLAARTTIPHTTVAVLSDNDADWKATKICNNPQTLELTTTISGPNQQTYEIKTSLFGNYNAQNSVLAFVAALQLGIPAENALAGIAGLREVPGRMNTFGGLPQNMPLVINDYAHTPDSIESLFNMVSQLTDSKVHAIIAHDGERQIEHRPKLGRLAGKLSGTIWVTDVNPRSEDPAEIRAQIISGLREVRPDLHDVVEVTTWRTDAVRRAILAAKPGEVVVSIAKGDESYQEIQGVKHSYDENQVIRESLAGWVKNQ